jgi:bacterioferritin
MSDLSPQPATGNGASQPFLSDVKTLRDQARKHVERGAVTRSYGGDVGQAVAILQSVLATEIVCTLRYTQHAIVATGLASEGVKAEFSAHAREEQQHAMQVAERINQLGGAPDFDPQTLTARAAAEYKTSDDLKAMIRENLVAERIAVEHYRELARYFGEKDPVTRVMIEGILAKEEEHASDMLDLLVRHGGLEGETA